MEGQIIQITDKRNKWYPLIGYVDEERNWGIRACILAISGVNVMPMYVRLEHSEFEYCSDGNVKIQAE